MHVSVGEGIAIVVFAGILMLASVNVRRHLRDWPSALCDPSAPAAAQ